jgi:hypothetical protein
MNKRIQKLAEQAGAETWSRPPMRAVSGMAFTDENLEKFAELVWKEAYESGYAAGCSDTFEGGV